MMMRDRIEDFKGVCLRRRQVGKSGIEVAALGMGCWSYGGGAYWGEQRQNDVNDVVAAALDAGVNYFDTAEVYNDGESERALGIALKGRRREAVIGSKVSTCNVAGETLRLHCEESLRRLQTDYIDLYMLHWPVNETSIAHFSKDRGLVEKMPAVAEVFGTLMDLQREGKIREIGISNHGVGQMREVLATGASIAVNELPYNLISRAIETEILPYCVENGIGVLGYMPYQQGILASDTADSKRLRPSQLHSRHFSNARGEEQSRHGEPGAEDEIYRLLSEVQKIAMELGVPVAAVSLAWAMGKEGVVSTLAGSRNRKQLELNLQNAGFSLPPEARAKLDFLSRPVWDRLGDSPDYYENRVNSRIW